MTWTPHMMYSGEGQDWESEIGSHSFTGRIAPKVQSSRSRTGSWGVWLDGSLGSGQGNWSFGTQANGLDRSAVWITPTASDGSPVRGIACQGGFGLSAAPTARRRIFGEKAGDGDVGIAVDTDRTIYLQNEAGAEVPGTRSTTLIPTTGLIDVVALWWKTPGGTWLFYLWVDDAWEVGPVGLGKGPWDSAGGGADAKTPDECAVGNSSWHGGEVDLFADDWCWLVTGDDADRPWATKYPFVRAKGGITAMAPAADGGKVEWDKGAGGYADVDEGGGNDGDTTFNQSTTEDAIHLHQWTGANPVPSGATVDGVQMGSVGRATGDGKNDAFFQAELGASAETGPPCQGNAPTYRGTRWVGVPKPGGGAWARDDFDAGDWDFGMIANSVDAGTRITLMWPLVVYHETADLVDLAPEPGALADKRGFRATVPHIESRPLVGVGQ